MTCCNWSEYECQIYWKLIRIGCQVHQSLLIFLQVQFASGAEGNLLDVVSLMLEDTFSSRCLPVFPFCSIFIELSFLPRTFSFLLPPRAKLGTFARFKRNLKVTGLGDTASFKNDQQLKQAGITRHQSSLNVRVSLHLQTLDGLPCCLFYLPSVYG